MLILIPIVIKASELNPAKHKFNSNYIMEERVCAYLGFFFVPLYLTTYDSILFRDYDL